jgi:hypothetical protein
LLNHNHCHEGLRSEWVLSVLLHTREVAGSKPAAPIRRNARYRFVDRAGKTE